MRTDTTGTVAAEGRPSARPLLVVELNEFDPEHLLSGSRRLGLRAAERWLSLPRSRTTTEDEREHHGLDPWVQWVGIHGGMPASSHGIRRLGVTRAQNWPQVWHVLAGAGLTWGAWGPMNAPRGDATGCAFFMPDPWSFDETAHPPEFDDALALPRYAARNYLDLDRQEVLAGGLRMLRFLARAENLGVSTRFAADLARGVAAAGPSIHAFTTLLDLLSARLFVALRQRTRPDFSLIFLNHIAHLQHQFWERGGRIHPEMELGLRVADRILDILWKARRPGEALLLLNGMRQGNVAGEGYVCYRQVNPQLLVRSLGVGAARVEQCMTSDGQLVLDDAAAADEAERILAGARLDDGRPLFFVERLAPDRVFYQIEIDRPVAPGTSILSGATTLKFDEHVARVCDRTGAHLQEGDLFADGVAVPPSLLNHEVFDAILGHFGVAAPGRTGAQAPGLSSLAGAVAG